MFYSRKLQVKNINRMKYECEGIDYIDYNFRVEYEEIEIDFFITNEVNNKVCYDLCYNDKVHEINQNVSIQEYTINEIIGKVWEDYFNCGVEDISRICNIGQVCHYLEKNKDTIKENC